MRRSRPHGAQRTSVAGFAQGSRPRVVNSRSAVAKPAPVRFGSRLKTDKGIRSWTSGEP